MRLRIQVARGGLAIINHYNLWRGAILTECVGLTSEELTAPLTPRSLYFRQGTDSDSSHVATPPMLSSIRNNRGLGFGSSGPRVSESSSRSSSMHPLMDSIDTSDVEQLDDYLKSQLSQDVLNQYVVEVCFHPLPIGQKSH